MDVQDLEALLRQYNLPSSNSWGLIIVVKGAQAVRALPVPGF